jgi:hypothetical protein
MRVRLGLILAAVLATLFSPISPLAQAFGGYASAPTSVSQTAIAGGVRVAWSAPTDVDTGITGYRVEYSTSGTSGTWTLWTTVGSSTYTSDILGLSQVATYVRVAGNTTAGTGAYGYPWTEVYRTLTPKRASNNETIIYDTGFGLGGSDAAALLNNTTTFTRVKYHMEATVNSTSSYADTDFYKWSGASIATLQVPTVGTSSSAFVVQTNVTDLNVYSNNSNVTKARGISGRLELWGWNYDIPKAPDYANGDATKYDYNDTSNGSGTFGSFQVHDINNFKTVFAWNYHHYTGSDNPNIGFGNNSSSSGHPDWTFCVDTLAQGPCVYTSNTFKLQIYINLAITPLADASPPTVSRIDSRFYAKNADTITVRSTELGTVYLVSQAVTVTNLASISSASSSSKISTSISSTNTNTTMTIGDQSNGLYNLYAADLLGNLSTAILATIRIDNTSPTATSIAVGSSGTYLQLTANETVTNSLQIFGMFAVTDSGSAISVNSIAVSGLTATLGLSRAIPAGATVYFTYTPSSGNAGGRIVDLAGNEMAPITSRTVTNNSTSPITVTLTLPDPISKGVSITASVSVSVAGKVTFYMSGKRIAGCLNKVAGGATPITVTCTFKPAVTARQTVSATLTPTLSAYPLTTSSVERYILKRSTTR